METIITAILSGTGALLLSGIILLIKKCISIIKKLETIEVTVSNIEKNDVKRGKQMRAIYGTGIGQMKAIKVSLEIIAGMQPNGHTEEAFEYLRQVEETYDEFNREEAWS